MALCMLALRTILPGELGNITPASWRVSRLVEGFTKQYGLRRLVCAEHYDDMHLARQRERNMKHWRRAWKVQLILASNPRWDDL